MAGSRRRATWPERGVEAGGGPTAPAAAAPLEALGDVAMLAGDLAAALAAYRGVAALAAPGDPAGLAVATANLALTLAYAGDDQARAAAEEAVAAALASANPTAIAMARFAEGEAFADADPERRRPPWTRRCGGPGTSATGSSPAPPSPRWWPSAAGTAPRNRPWRCSWTRSTTGGPAATAPSW